MAEEVAEEDNGGGGGGGAYLRKEGAEEDGQLLTEPVCSQLEANTRSAQPP